MEPVISLDSGAALPRTAPKHQGALALVTALFFMMGLITSLNDVLIPHLKAVYTLNYVQAMLVQFCFFGAYFIVSLPAGMLIRRMGYQGGTVAGFLLAAVGALLFYPAANSGYAAFLGAFFVLAAGITILQVAANPYVTVLGDPRTASSRLTLTQAFNSLGTTIAPGIGGALILAGAALSPGDLAHMLPAQQAAYRQAEAAAVQMPYLGLAATLGLLALLFTLVRLPKIAGEDTAASVAQGATSLLSHRRLMLGVVGLFTYVGAEVSIGSFLINFLAEPTVMGLAPAAAARYVSYYWGCAMIGRFIGFAAMRFISPGKALAFNALAAIVLVLCAVFGQGPLALWSIVLVGLCNSIMFPTIFSMSVHKLGPMTGQASGVLCMAIVGGAVVPFLQGALADAIGLRWSYFLPMACYGFILYFGCRYANMYREARHENPTI
ncbi:MAG: sugar MFS transporter [Paucibacter sp.]|nr:sugar MFS transporter [Roseateles sp.]